MSNYKPFEILLNSGSTEDSSIRFFTEHKRHRKFVITFTNGSILFLFKARQIFHIIFVESILITYCMYYVHTCKNKKNAFPSKEKDKTR